MPKGVRAPYGYTEDWKIDETTARDIRLIFQLACAGKSYKTMMRHLPGWKQDKIYYYIQQPVYTGAFRYKDDGELCVEEAHHPAIISREVFEAVQVLQQMKLLGENRTSFTEAELLLLDYAWAMGVAAWGEDEMLKVLEEE